MLVDGRVVVVFFSEKFDDICPPEANVVRAEMILGGYLLAPISTNETNVIYLSQVCDGYICIL